MTVHDDSALAAQAGSKSHAPSATTNRLYLLGLIILIGFLTAPQLPTGICFGDSGELQLAAATLGITHPPGYDIFALIAHPLTWLPGLDPAQIVAWAGLAAGLAALALLAAIQMALGVAAPVACSMTLLLCAFGRVWFNLIIPEVYLPSLALSLGAIYLMVQCADRFRMTGMMGSSLCLGVLVASRPPALPMLIFWMLSLGYVLRHRSVPKSIRGKAWAWAAICLLTPTLVALTYTWVRDRPDTAYNYIDQYNHEFNVLPEADDGANAKLKRLVWQKSAIQYKNYFLSDANAVRNKLLIWLPIQFAENHFIASILIPIVAILGVAMGSICQAVALVLVALVVIALARLGRRHKAAALLVGGMLLTGMVYQVVNESRGDSADLFPVLAAVCLLCPLAFSSPRRPATRAVSIGNFVLVALVVWTIVDAPNRATPARRADAAGFLSKLDFQSLPDRTVVCTSWHHAPPLWYAQCVLTHRTDVLILNSHSDHWTVATQNLQNRPIVSTTIPPIMKGWSVKAYRNIWQWNKESGEAGETHASQ